MRNISKVAKDYWDYTTLDPKILAEAARLTAEDLPKLARPGFTVRFYDTRESFFTAEALEYVQAWREATAAPSRGHLRAHRAHRAASPGGPDRERSGHRV